MEGLPSKDLKRPAEDNLQPQGKKLSNIAIQKLKEFVLNGIESEKIVIAYTNILITAMNPLLTIPIEERDRQYEALINCCQRHVCKIESAYCKSNPCDKCRFNYLMELSEAIHIEFKATGTSVKASIILKRIHI